MGLLEDESHEGPGVDHLAGGVAPGNPVEDHLVAVLRLVPLRKDSRVIVLENAVSNFVADEKKKQGSVKSKSQHFPLRCGCKCCDRHFEYASAEPN